jgi:hypothetical protein
MIKDAKKMKGKTLFLITVALFIPGCMLFADAKATAKNQKKIPDGQAVQENLEIDPLTAKTIVCAPEPTSVKLSTWVEVPVEYYYSWGESRDYLNNKTDLSNATGKNAVSYVIKGLRANTHWYYQLHWKAVDVWHDETIADFETPRVPGQSYSFIIEADPHLDESSSLTVYTQNLAYMRSLSPDFVMDLGDSSMIEKLTKGSEEAATRYKLLRSYWDNLGDIAPFYMALGNHDGEFGWPHKGKTITPAEAAALRRATLPNPIPAQSDFYSGVSDTAYSFTWGDALIIVLDPFSYTKDRSDNWGWTLGKEQYDWLSQTLSTTNALYRFVFIHHLVGGDVPNNSRGGVDFAGLGEWGGSDSVDIDNSSTAFLFNRPGWAMPIHDLLVKGNVTIVFHGHDHFYAKEQKDGIIYQMVPQPSFGLKQNVTKLANEIGYKNADLVASPGFLLLTVTPQNVKVELLNAGTEGAIRTYTVDPLKR